MYVGMKTTLGALLLSSLLVACTHAPGDGLEAPKFEPRTTDPEGTSTEPGALEPEPVNADAGAFDDRQPDASDTQPLPTPTPPPPMPETCTLPTEPAEPNDASLIALAPEGGCGSLTAMNDVDKWTFAGSSTRTKVFITTTAGLTVTIDHPDGKISGAGNNVVGPLVFNPRRAGPVTITLSKGQANDVRYRITVIR
jgi:hypothetical protein